MTRFALLFALAVPAQAMAALNLWVVGTPVPGDAVTLRVSALTPGETAVLVGGTTPGQTCAGPVCAGIAHARRIATAVADANGAVEVVVPLPDALAVGGGVLFQAIQPVDGQTSPVATRTLSDRVGLFGVWDDLSGVYGQIEVDNQHEADAIRTTDLHDFDNAGSEAFATWLRQNGWYYWERMSWTTSGGDTYACWSMPTPDERTARLLGPIDASDPTQRGCLGGPWTPLVPAEPEIAGAWHDAAGRSVQLDRSRWSWGRASGDVSRFSNRERSLIGQNAPGAPAAGRWTRLDWTTDAAGAPWLCATRRDAPSEWAARTTPPADPGDLRRGCAGAAWTPLTP